MSTGANSAYQAMNNVPFFQHAAFAVVGASSDTTKFGNKVLKCYQHRGFPVVPINKKTPEIEGLSCVESLTVLSENLPSGVTNAKDIGVSIITPPGITPHVIKEGYELGYRSFFLQPGSYTQGIDFDNHCKNLGDDITIIKSCVLVDLDCGQFH
jgi:uncharacterized protein